VQVAHSFEGTPKLFELMEGLWLGKGTRTQVYSGKQLEVTSETVSVIEGEKRDLLASTNRITETPIPPHTGTPKTYERKYWITPHPTEENTYLFLTQKDQQFVVTSVGSLKDRTLQVQQIIQFGNQTLRVEAKTQFEEQPLSSEKPRVSYYEDSIYMDDKLTSKANVEYRQINTTP
jgi:hypothetical protein